MRTTADRRLRLLVGAVVVDTAFAVLMRLAVALDFPSRGSVWVTTLAWVALGWLVVFVAALVHVLSYVHDLDRELSVRRQVIEAHSLSSREWIWEATPDLVWTYSNDRVLDLLGYRPEELLGRSLLELLAADDAHVARSTAADAIARDAGWEAVELSWRHADGQMVRLEGSASVIHDQRGRVIGFRGSRRLASPSRAADMELAAIRDRVADVLRSRSLRIALQPIVSLATGRLVAVEALARFPDNRPPDRWFHEARGIGRGVEVELLAIEAALDLLPDLPQTCRLSVNASPECVIDPRFSAVVTSATGAMERLCVEITEHVAIDRYDDIETALLPLRERGLHLAVDDAGAGYASFNHVLRLRPNSIKLDRSLITRIDTDPARRALITAVVLVALEMQASVTAEGVETTDEFQTLATLGVDAAQGYFLARPQLDPGRWRAWATREWLPSRRSGEASLAT